VFRDFGEKMKPSDMLRREMLLGLAGSMALPLISKSVFAAGDSGADNKPASGGGHAPDRAQWQQLDAQIRTWWDQDLTQVFEKDIREDEQKTLLFLPNRYLRISVGPAGTYQAQFPFDTTYMNYGLFAHERTDIVRGQILNYLFLIERYGFAPNANYTWLLTRSQSAFVPNTVWRYYLATQDLDLLYQAYPLLKQEYTKYWNAPHHQTPIGLATCRDLGDPELTPELASEAETSLDWMPIYGGDVRRCGPIGVNCALVSYARVIALIANALGHDDEARKFNEAADHRTALMHKYCWNEKMGMFLEYDYVAAKQLPYISECAYWTLWSGIATKAQAARLVANLPLIEKLHGVACTDKAYPDPHTEAMYKMNNPKYQRLQDMPPAPDAPAEYLGGRQPLMWMYPAGWASTQMIVSAGLDAYGYGKESRDISTRFLAMLLDQYKKTGQLWEKYNVVDGSLVLPNSRYGNIPYHSFTAAAVVLLGRRVFENQPLKILN
jgi:alpha,alpha-trehalase